MLMTLIMTMAMMVLLPITKRLYSVSDNLYWKVLECGEAVALLVGGDEQSGFVNIPSLTRYILSTITKYILHHYIFYKTYWLPRRLQLANGDLSTICWVHQSSPFAPGGILHILCLWCPHLCPCSPNQEKKHEKSGRNPKQNRKKSKRGGSAKRGSKLSES